MAYENFYNQQRLNNYPYQNNMVASGLKGRPVSSIEEVKAMQIDFDGSLFIFPDIGNKKIYTKQIGMDGIAILNMYELKPIPALNHSDYVTREEFENAVLSIKEALGSKDSPNKDKQISKETFNF